jgi:hypothetical protein
VTDTPKPQRPVAVTWAFWIWVLATCVGLGGAALLFAATPPHERRLQEWVDERNMVAALGIMLAGWALARLVFAWFLLHGHAWARVLLTTVAALGLATVIMHVEHVSPLNWVAIAMNAVAIVLQFLPSSNAYFAQSGQHPEPNSPADINAERTVERP